MGSNQAAGAVSEYDAVVVGAGPNGLSAAIVLAAAGLSVVLLEAKETVGGGCRTAELTLPGFAHDVCSAVHPLGICSPFFRSLPLAECDLTWIHPATPLAHPLDDGTAAVLEKSLDETCVGLGPDAKSYHNLMKPLVAAWERLVEDILRPPGIPRHPVSFSRFGLNALRSAGRLAESRFRGERTRALFAGMAAHGVLPLDRAPTAAFLA
jgi:phytoene dehydrogenase-like protein